MADELALIEPGDDSPYAVLRQDPNDLRELLADALGGETLAFKDLDRIKVPSGGGTTWEIPTLNGEVATKEIRGVIIHRATRRSYWPTPLEDRGDDDDGRPDCASVDGRVGIGNPGGDCASCPMNEWNSDIKGGPGKACKETRQLFVLTENDLLPLAITIPPGSLAGAKDYFMRLLRAQLSPTDVVTVISLSKQQNAAKINFARVEFTAAERLSPEARNRVKEYATAMRPAMELAAMVKQDEVE
jgi:hypothetical protein